MQVSEENLVGEAQRARRQMLEGARSVTPSHGRFKVAPDHWSIAEVLEHLVLAEQNGTHGMWIALESTRRGDPQWKQAHPHRDKTIEHIAAQTMRAKEDAPPGAWPALGGPAAYWAGRLEANQCLLVAFAEEVQPDELDEVIYPHFLMGPLTIRQRFQFIRWHIEHHIPQVERLINDASDQEPTSRT